MTIPYENIPRVLPDSQASSAVDEINAYIAQNGNQGLDQAVRKIIEKHGGDPVTAAGMGGAIKDTLAKDPAAAQERAEQLVGISIADPAVAARQAERNVQEAIRTKGLDPQNLSKQQQKELAGDAAIKAVNDAGGQIDSTSKAKLQQEVNQAIENGSSPSEAAAAVVGTYMAGLVMAAMPADGFNIFGYVSFLVHGPVTYTFKSKETIDVAQPALHNYISTLTYEMRASDFVIDAQTIKTTGVTESARAHSAHAKGIYKGSYTSLSLLQVTSFPLGWNSHFQQFSLTGILVSGNGVRVYGAFFDGDKVTKNKFFAKARDKRVELAQLKFGQRFLINSGTTKI